VRHSRDTNTTGTVKPTSSRLVQWGSTSHKFHPCFTISQGGRFGIVWRDSNQLLKSSQQHNVSKTERLLCSDREGHRIRCACHPVCRRVTVHVLIGSCISCRANICWQCVIRNKIIQLTDWHAMSWLTLRLCNDLYCVGWGVKLYSLDWLYCYPIL